MANPAPLITNPPGMLDELRAAVGADLIDGVEAVEEITLNVHRDSLARVIGKLRDDFAYQQLMEIAGVDYPDRAERFDVCYHLLSVTRNHRVRVRVRTDETQPVPSVTSLYPNAGWLEREVFDMYGVLFAGNSDLRRILTDYGFVGHPFRKDFPLTGYVELRYSEVEKRVVYEPVELPQDFRSFDFMSPWEGARYVLPGDEKYAEPEAKGAPTPLTAAEIRKADTAQAAPKEVAVAPPPAPPAAAAPAAAPAKAAVAAAPAKEEAKPRARKPRAAKAAEAAPAKAAEPAKRSRAPKAAPAAEAKAPAKPRAPRKPKGAA